MIVEFLGTSAADCKSSTNKNREHRFFSSVLIDGILLIDPGPDVFESAAESGLTLKNVKYVINTHMHTDHYSESSLAKLLIQGARFITFEPYETKILGKYKITAYNGNHGTSSFTFHFMVSDGKKALYYALDGAWLLYDEYIAIKNEKPDMLVLDCTVGDKKGDYRVFEHNDLRMVEELTFSLNPYVGSIYISHIAPTLHQDHRSLAERLHGSGVKVAYDGLSVKL